MAKALTEHWMERTRDTRKIQPLGEVIPLHHLNLYSKQEQYSEAGRLERCRAVDAASADSCSQNKLQPSGNTQEAAPRPNQHVSPRTASSWDKALSWSPVAAARQVLSVDRPEMLSRMEEAVVVCRRAHNDRNYRFNSLGVFDSSKNAVRARSMLRVHMHKELSTTSMRVPQAHKEVRADRPDDTLPARLERMFVRVLKSIDDHPKQGPAAGRLSVWVGNGPPSPHRRITDATSITGFGPHHARARPHYLTASVQHGQSTQQELGTPHSTRNGCSKEREPRGTYHSMEPNSPVWPLGSGTQQAYNRCQVHQEASSIKDALSTGWPSPHSHHQSSSTQLHRPSAVGAMRRSTSGFFSPSAHTPKSAAPWGQDMQRRHSPAWTAHLPPEIAAAQIAHLTTVTQEAIARYHAAVVEAQKQALLAAGLPEDAQFLGPQGLAEQLNGQPGAISEDGDEGSTASAKEVPCPVHDASTLPELIQAALQHVGDMSEELRELQASLPKKEHKPARRAKPSIPMRPIAGANGATATTMQGGSTAAQTAAAGAGQEVEIWPSLLGRQRHTSRSWSSNEEWEDDQCEDEDGQIADAGKEGGQGTSLQQKLSQEMQAVKSPRGTRAPVNQSPITDKRLEAFQELLQDAAREVEVGCFTVTPLPPLPPSRTVSQHIQARLERVWDVLQLPLATRLDSVLAFTDRKRTGELETALQVWELCAAAVVQREQLLGVLSDMQMAISQNQVGRVTLSHLESQCVTLHKVTQYIVQQAEKLQASHGIELSYGGIVYPGPEIVKPEDMIRFMEWLRDEAPSTVLIMPN